ncbi:unnamed protein product [Cunninghamella blakesleeana]
MPPNDLYYIIEAIDFVGRLLQSKLDPTLIQSFKDKLYTVLIERFVNHWDVSNPYKGNGYRSICNFNGQLYPVFILAANQAGISPTTILVHLPNEFVLWVDPSSVSYRVGDHGNIMNLFTNGKSFQKQTFKTTTSTTSTPIRISPPPSPASSDKNVQQQKQPSSSPTPPSSSSSSSSSSPLALHTKKDQQVSSASPRHKPMVLVH